MTKLFSIDQVPPAKRFRFLQELNEEVFGKSQMRQLTDEPLHSRIESTNIGGITVNDMEAAVIENVISPRDRSSKAGAERLIFKMLVSGTDSNEQLGRNCVLQGNDMCLADDRYGRVCRYSAATALRAISIPRTRLERALGPSRHYAGLRIEGSLPSASLVRTFLSDLVRLHRGFSPKAATRMTDIGVDLIAATIAERMGREPARSVRDSALVQRAKAYVEANLGESALDPPRLAAAMGVSLRRLQQLFHAHGRHISDWIWERRLQNAARRLADPGCAHLPISALAYGCGFASQAHFSRRFRDRFGISPRDWRRAASDRAPNLVRQG